MPFSSGDDAAILCHSRRIPLWNASRNREMSAFWGCFISPVCGTDGMLRLSRFRQPGRFTFSVMWSTYSAAASKTGLVALGAGISSTDGLCRSLAERWHKPMPHCCGFVQSIPKPPPTPLTAPPPAPAPSEWPFPACPAGNRAAAGCAAPKLAAGPERSPAASSRW